MKPFQVLVIIASLSVGLGFGYDNANRSIFVYVNLCPGYSKLNGPIDPSHCLGPDNKPCYYITTIDRGPTTSQAILIADGATAGTPNKCYIP